ncbi:MAG: hypothetical protein R3F61_04895 [Myxococcota bacterium]
MIWVVLMACGQPEQAAEPTAAGEPTAVRSSDATEGTVPGNTDDWPTADQILLAHTRRTSQCDLLATETYKLTWTATTLDGHAAPRVEEILHQGRPASSYTRIHQRREPDVRFAAFGRTPEGKFWSASDGGVQADLPDEVSASLAAGMDPTPVCNWEKRWSRRELVGPEDRSGTPTWHLKVYWNDGTPTDLWFHREKELLVASSAKVGEIDTTTEVSEYRQYGSITWPTLEVATRKEGPLQITTTQKLLGLETNLESFVDVGPRQVDAILASAAKEAQP